MLFFFVTPPYQTFDNLIFFTLRALSKNELLTNSSKSHKSNNSEPSIEKVFRLINITTEIVVKSWPYPSNCTKQITSNSWGRQGQDNNNNEEGHQDVIIIIMAFYNSIVCKRFNWFHFITITSTNHHHP